MMIRISGIPNTNTNSFYSDQNRPMPETHFYEPDESKEKVKEDFGMKLDKEMEKLTIDIIL